MRQHLINIIVTTQDVPLEVDRNGDLILMNPNKIANSSEYPSHLIAEDCKDFLQEGFYECCLNWEIKVQSISDYRTDEEVVK